MKLTNDFCQTVILYDDFAQRMKKTRAKGDLKTSCKTEAASMETLAVKLATETDNLKRMHGARRK